MAYNISGFGTVVANGSYLLSYWINSGQDFGAQYAQGKPEGAALDGSADGALISTNHQISLDVGTQAISYVFQILNPTNSDTSFMLCGGGVI
jgi:hypothetical protein